MRKYILSFVINFIWVPLIFILPLPQSELNCYILGMILAGVCGAISRIVLLYDDSSRKLSNFKGD